MKELIVTTIEKKVNELTPDFVVCTSELIRRFHSYEKWNCPVHFKGKTVTKKILSKGVLVSKDYKVAMPDFVLMNSDQMVYLNEAISSASRGRRYCNPFLRNVGWYIEVFGEYWHSEDVTGVSREEHVKQVMEAYASSGNRVLILWENDILYRWSEVCKPLVDRYIGDFLGENTVSSVSGTATTISGEAIHCLNDASFYRGLSEEKRSLLLDELCNCYGSTVPFDDWGYAKNDLHKFKDKIRTGFTSINSLGNSFLDYFVRSRFDARVRGQRSINEIWGDSSLLRECVNWQLMNEDGVHHSKRFLAAMLFRSRFRSVNGMSASQAIVRVKDYSIKGGLFFDPCAGWGGRMLSAYAMGMKYVAIDANSKLVEELKSVARYLDFDAEIYHGDSSDEKFVCSVLRGRKIDLCFTSPPYFDAEIYSADSAQSIIKYPNKKDWYSFFLSRMFAAVLDNLKDTGNFIVNVNSNFDFSKVVGFLVNELTYVENGRLKDDHYFLVKKDTVEVSDLVRCRVCGKSFGRLGWHLRKKHNITSEEYATLYPDAGIISKEHSQRVSDANKKRIRKGGYSKRVVYLLPDGSYAGKLDKYLREWGCVEVKEEHVVLAENTNYGDSGIEGIDYVACKVCGIQRRSLTRHIKDSHGMGKEEYISKYGSPVQCAKADEALHNGALKKWQNKKEIDKITDADT